MSDVDVIVRIEHIRALTYCSHGARDFARRHGLDWLTFVRDGIPAAQLRATGDAMALAVVEIAEREAAQNG